MTLTLETLDLVVMVLVVVCAFVVSGAVGFELGKLSAGDESDGEATRLSRENFELSGPGVPARARVSRGGHSSSTDTDVYWWYQTSLFVKVATTDARRREELAERFMAALLHGAGFDNNGREYQVARQAFDCADAFLFTAKRELERESGES